MNRWFFKKKIFSPPVEGDGGDTRPFLTAPS
jgi:hypothetical protein